MNTRFRGVLLSLSGGLLIALLGTAVLWHRVVLSPRLVAHDQRAMTQRVELLVGEGRAIDAEALVRRGAENGARVCIRSSTGNTPDCADLDVAFDQQSANPSGVVELGPNRWAIRRALPDGAVLVAAEPAPHTENYALFPLLALLTLGGIGAGLFMTGFATRLANRDLALLLTHTQALASGEDRAPLHLPESAELEGIAGSIQQLSGELQRTVRELAAERDRFQAVLVAMSEGVMALDRGGRTLLLNPAARELLGLPEAVTGRRLVEIVDIDELDELLEDLEDEEYATAEFVRTVGGEPLRLLISGTAREDGGCVLVLHDMTEIRRLESLRRDFVANVSHELRTPVAVVQASAEALYDGAMDDPQYATHFLSAILRNTARLASLINDLLSLSRVEEGRYKFLFADIDLADAVHKVVEALSPRLSTRGHALQVELQPGLAVRADASALEQVLVNLLENAMKYTPEGGHLAVRGHAIDAETAAIEVVDDGPGIDPVHLPRLFERFYRVDAGRSREVGGTGLGLAIVKHLVEAMSGEVGMEQNHPRGSIFWVRLPVVRIQAPPDPPEAEEE